MRRYTCLLVFLLFWTLAAQAQVVWPGDVNSNGIVNSVDVLYVGLAYGSMGPERINGSENWEAQNISSFWGTAFPGGVDYAYADCNGDGQIDEDDLKGVIRKNFGLIHGARQADGFSNGAAGVHPPLILEPEMSVTEWGARLNIDLRLGSETFPVSNFYGIAIKMSYKAGVINQNADEEGFDFELNENSWVGSGDDHGVEYVFRKDHAAGKAELAITRIDQNFISQGSGSIGNFSVVVEDIIVGSEMDTFTIQIDSVLYLDDQFNIYPIVPDSSLVIIRDSSSSVTNTEDELLGAEWRVYPNPAHSYFIIETQSAIDRIRVYNAMGRTMPLSIKHNALGKKEIRTDHWPDGLYYLELSTGTQSIVKKLAVVAGKI